MKKYLHNPLKKQIATALHQILPEIAGLSVEQCYDFLVIPPGDDMGDLAFGCFALAKALRKSPAAVAQDLKAQFAALNVPCVASVVNAGPYLNFHLAMKAVGEQILDSVLDQSFFSLQLQGDLPKTMLEFSQPNTHKEVHVGHMRNLCLGDSLVRILRYTGYNVVSTTFPGDVGTHVAKCLWYMKFKNQEPVPVTGKGEWLGRMYSKGNILLEDEAGTPKEAENKKHLTEILKQLEAKSGEFYDLWLVTREWSIELMNDVYAWADVKFDQWYWESEVDSTSVQYARELYTQGKLVQSQGAIGMDLSGDNLGFCMLIKSDGTGLYATKDIELARRKFEDHKIEKSVYVVDVRQTLHFQQVFRVLELLGFPQAKNCHHLPYNFVELPEGAMSSRKGNIIPLMVLVEQMREAVKRDYLVRYAGDWEASEIERVADQVAKGAIKFGMVRIDNNKKIVFDLKEWLKIEGESGPFIQYSCARVKSLVRKLSEEESRTADWSLLTEKAEKALAVALMHFNSVLLQAADNERPAFVTAYLYEIAKRFNVFYHDCPIGQAPTPQLKLTRLKLAQATGMILAKGLSLLGIPTPDRM